MNAVKRSERSEQQPLMRPVLGLVKDLHKKDLEHLTIEAIKNHRRLRNEAEALEAASTDQASTPDTIGQLRLAWVSAMIRAHMQQALLSTLLDVLGYIPDVPNDEPSRRLRSA